MYSLKHFSRLFQGHLGKKMDLLPAFREHFFVLQPHLLTFYNGSSQKEKRGDIKIDAQCRQGRPFVICSCITIYICFFRCESVPDSTSKSPIKKPGSKSHSKFLVHANEKTYEFQAQDHRYIAIDHFPFQSFCSI